MYIKSVPRRIGSDAGQIRSLPKADVVKMLLGIFRECAFFTPEDYVFALELSPFFKATTEA